MRFSKIGKIFPSIFIFLLFGSITLLVWHHKNTYDIKLLRKHTEMYANQVHTRMEEFLSTRIASLHLMADRWVERRPVDFSKVRFFQFAKAIYKDFPGYLAINFINSEGIIVWVYPLEPNIRAKNEDIYHHPEPFVRNIFEKVKTSKEYQISPVIKLFQGQLGFGTYWPLIYEDAIQGYLNGVFSIPKIMKICLSEGILDDFTVRLYENGRLIYSHTEGKQSGTRENTWFVSKEIKFWKKIWQLEIEPHTPLSKTTAFSMNLSILISGMILSLILSVLLYLVLQRTELYRESRNQALSEIEVRKRIEEKHKYLLSELSTKNEEMESFLYTVSHDLKTPIVTIEGFVGALKEDYGNIMEEEGKHYITRIKEGTRKIDALINDLLKLSRIGHTTEKKTTIPFHTLFNEALEPFQSQIENRGIRIQIMDTLPLLYGERKKLAQLVSNLISNAIKFIGEHNPDPCIEIGVKKADGKSIFFVRDNGIGIDPHHFHKIFQVFQRLPNAKNIEGTGVGLAIVKRIIDLHGGKIWVESEKDTGSTFFFTIEGKEE